MEDANLKFEVLNPPLSDDFINELKAISDEWLKGRKEMGYSIGAFDVEYLNSSPIFVMSNGDGKVQAFANIMTIKNTDILSIDLMRHRNDSINSIMEMLFLSIANWGKDEDYKYFDIGIAPLSNEETSHILEQKKS